MKIKDFQDPKKSQSDFWETGNPLDFPVHRKSIGFSRVLLDINRDSKK